MSDFSELVKSVQESTGTRGFGARKRAAAEIIGSDIEALGPISGVAGQILADLTVETDRVGKATDPEELKEISNRLREYKGIINQTYKQLGDENKFSKTQADNLRKLITTSQRNIKKAGRGLFGKANESFLESLTETLNPFTKIGDVFAQLPGGAPFEAYFNSLGEGINDKIKGALGIGGLTDDNVEKVEQYVSGKQDLEETQADYEEGRPKTKSDFVSDPTESNEQGLQSNLGNISDFKKKNYSRNNFNSSKLINKYSDLAREALSIGDKILYENYMQHAEHFIRVSHNSSNSSEIKNGNAEKTTKANISNIKKDDDLNKDNQIKAE